MPGLFTDWGREGVWTPCEGTRLTMVSSCGDGVSFDISPFLPLPQSAFVGLRRDKAGFEMPVARSGAGPIVLIGEGLQRSLR